VDATPAQTIMKLFEEEVEDTIKEPTFLIDYPTEVCPLSKMKEGDPKIAERFELYLGGLEVANAYSELNDPADQFKRFQEQMAQRRAGVEEAAMMDEDYVFALEHGMPPTSGLGVGIDRLVMLLTNCGSIRDVILFPLMRPVEHGEMGNDWDEEMDHKDDRGRKQNEGSSD
jgi:lysyl-tRNA synthetase class 2